MTQVTYFAEKKLNAKRMSYFVWNASVIDWNGRNSNWKDWN